MLFISQTFRSLIAASFFSEFLKDAIYSIVNYQKLCLILMHSWNVMFMRTKWGNYFHRIFFVFLKIEELWLLFLEKLLDFILVNTWFL